MTWYLSKTIHAYCLRTCFDVWLCANYMSHQKTHKQQQQKKKIKEAVWVQTVQVEIGSNGQRWRKQSCSYIKNPWLSKLTKKELVLKTHSDSYLGLNLTVASTHTSICKILLDTSMNTEISSRKRREKCINGFMWDQE